MEDWIKWMYETYGIIIEANQIGQESLVMSVDEMDSQFIPEGMDLPNELGTNVLIYQDAKGDDYMHYWLSDTEFETWFVRGTFKNDKLINQQINPK